MALLRITEGHSSNAKNKIDNIPIENVSINRKLLIQNLIEQMKPIVMGDKRGSVLMSRKIIDEWFFGKISDSQDSSASKNSTVFTSIFLNKWYVL